MNTKTIKLIADEELSGWYRAYEPEDVKAINAVCGTNDNDPVIPSLRAFIPLAQDSGYHVAIWGY